MQIFNVYVSIHGYTVTCTSGASHEAKDKCLLFSGEIRTLFEHLLSYDQLLTLWCREREKRNVPQVQGTSTSGSLDVVHLLLKVRLKMKLHLLTYIHVCTCMCHMRTCTFIFTVANWPI